MSLAAVEDREAESGFDAASWEEQLAELAHVADRCQWDIGDKIIEAPAVWGETYTRAAAITRRSEKTLRNWAVVCRKFDASRRRDNLKFGHHEAVVSLPEGQQEKYLDQAGANEWTVEDLRQHARAVGSAGRASDPKDRVVVMVPRARIAAFAKAAGVTRKPDADQKKGIAKWLLELGEKAVAS